VNASGLKTDCKTACVHKGLMARIIIAGALLPPFSYSAFPVYLFGKTIHFSFGNGKMVESLREFFSKVSI
jgi:hypothetical protein